MENPQTPTTKDHDLLIEISTKLDLYISQSNLIIQDHESRLRKMEQTIQKLKGVQWFLGGLGAVFTTIISVIQIFVK